MVRKSLVTTCVIPAAGRGSRWAPISGYLPKEMLPLIDRPVIEWVVQEGIAAGCKHFIIIINKHKQVIRDYFLKHKKFAGKIMLDFIYQEEPNGLSPAILLTKNLIKHQAFAVALPDLPTISNKSVLGQLIQNYPILTENTHLISMGSFSTETLHLYSECLVELRSDKLLNIIHFCPKDSVRHFPHHPGSKIRMSGRYVFSTAIFSVIEKIIKVGGKEEINEVKALQAAALAGQQILGIKIEGHTYDTGNPVSYIRANTAFFKKRLP